MPLQNRPAKALTALSIEDNEDDAFLILHALKTNFDNLDFVHVPGKRELEEYLAGGGAPSVILSDWSLPQFDGLAALAMLRAAGIDSPFIIVSGKIGEEAAIKAIRQGVYDYVLKDNLARLPTAIRHALDDHENERKARKDNAFIALQATALRAAPAAIAIFTPDMKLEWANPAFGELTGYSDEELLNSDIRTTGEAAGDPSKELILYGVNRTKDGRAYFEEQKICPVVDPDGRLAHFVIIKKDISAQEQRKKELEQDLWLTTAISQAKTPEALCQSVVSHLKEQCPEGRQGICLFSGAATNSVKCYGDLQDPCDSADRADSADPAPEAMRFERAWTLGQEKLGIIRIQCSRTSPLDQEKLFDALSKKLEPAFQRMAAQQKVAEQVRNISFLRLIGRTISGDMDFEMMAEPLLRQIQKFLESDSVALYLNDKEDSGILSCRAQSGFRTGLIESARVEYGQPYVGIAAEEQRIVSIPSFEGLTLNAQFSELIRAEKFVSQYCAPIIVAGKTIGVLEIFQRKPFIPNPEWMILFDAIAAQAGLALDYNSIYSDLQRAYLDLELSYEATIEGWSAAMDYRDQETEGHAKRVASLTLSLAASLGIPAEEIAQIGRGALLHDVGKIGIPDSILKKPGPLSAEEWELMKKHPLIAYEMLSRIPYLQSSLDIPLYHHEKWDGSGYPEGLKGDKIPLAARLFSIIDVFDALTSDRPYRKAWSKSDTLRYIREQSGIQFDPDIVRAFIAMIEGARSQGNETDTQF